MTDAPDVVGAVEASKILGIELGRISRWRKRGKLPPAYSEPKCSPVWLRKDIERFRDNGMNTDGVKFTEPPRQMPLLGTHEVAELLEVDKSQIGRWRRTPPKNPPHLPEPVTQIKAGSLWDRQDVLRFIRARRRAEEEALELGRRDRGRGRVGV